MSLSGLCEGDQNETQRKKKNKISRIWSNNFEHCISPSSPDDTSTVWEYGENLISAR